VKTSGGGFSEGKKLQEKPKKKVLISACLLGELCRYDGATKENNAVIDKFKDCEVIPFCPEAPVLGTPRERISVVFKDKQYKLITDETKIDVTELIERQVDLLVQGHPDLDMIVLKSKSPSCGLGTTPILNENGKILMYDDGIAVSRLKEKYPEIQIVDENNLKEVIC